ncbi:regulatory protein GemA [Novosphingobium sp. EMRT-2]|uniref:regulatory protein GemA n=1 Tax=Novosphingobium sp. EMRT-2 TaxID=2571749 RepID=UPI0010BD162B|nr:regulatory protein GemA [Novosphingobium sp. EMRT-2]QCI93244.1 regulatory protein GemA [Novosphingobium sp. EMRT-2]
MAKTVHVHHGRRQGKTSAERLRFYRAVRAACHANKMDDDDRKALQSRLIGKESLSDMTIGEMARLLDHLNRGHTAPAGHRAHIGKVRALWWSLYWLGLVDKSDDRAIGAFVKRQTGVSALRFLDHRHAPAVIEALKFWLEREGVQWPTSEETAAIQIETDGFTATHHERCAVINALRGRIDRHGGGSAERIAAWVEGQGYDRDRSYYDLHVAELDGLIRHLGGILRLRGE